MTGPTQILVIFSIFGEELQRNGLTVEHEDIPREYLASRRQLSQCLSAYSLRRGQLDRNIHNRHR
jgi:hypothetical protein